MGKQDQQPGSVKTHKTLGFLGYCRGAWLRQKSCQEISYSRSGGTKEAGFA